MGIQEYTLQSRDTCKNFWRLCIEHHSFFKLEQYQQRPKQPVLLKRGSMFRYSGKTQKQLVDLVESSNFRRSQFTRTSSRVNKGTNKLHNYTEQQPTANIPHHQAPPPDVIPSEVQNAYKNEQPAVTAVPVTDSPVIPEKSASVVRQQQLTATADA